MKKVWWGIYDLERKWGDEMFTIIGSKIIEDKIPTWLNSNEMIMTM